MDASYRRPVVTGARPGGYSTPGGSKSGSSSSKQPLRPTLSYQHHLDPAQALKQKQKHQLQSLRKKWTSYFSETASLEGGISNRLTLSLASHVPSEIDWALERLVQITFLDPDMIRLSEYPGLIAALMGLIRFFLDMRSRMRESGMSFWPDETREATLRRACEAALVIKNLAAADVVNTAALMANRKLPDLIVDVLEEGTREGIEGEETTELRLYLLEIFEALATKYIVTFSPSSVVASTHRPIPASSRIYPLLILLTRSPDRALLLSAYRILAILSHADPSARVLALASYSLVLPAFPVPHPVFTAIELLLTADVELTTTLLQYLYEHTLLPANAIDMCTRPDLVHLLRIIASCLKIGGKIAKMTLELPQPNSQAMQVWNTIPPIPRYKPVVPPVVELSYKLDAVTLARIIELREPHRSIEWMKLLFEADPNSEITQVLIWSAYCAEIEPHDSEENPALKAPDLIKTAMTAIPQAMPMVTESERKFIIRGMRLRDSTVAKAKYPCQWRDCSSPIGPTSSASLYSHLHHQHLVPLDLATPPSMPLQCCWKQCKFSPSSVATIDSPSLPLNELSLHVRTHLPNSIVPSTIAPSLPEDPPTFEHENYHAPESTVRTEGEPGLPPPIIGINLSASSVLRNLARTVNRAMEAGSKVTEQVTRTINDESILAMMQDSNQVGGKGVTDVLSGVLDELEYGRALKGVEGLLGVEEVIVAAGTESSGLITVLSEVIWIMKKCHHAR